MSVLSFKRANSAQAAAIFTSIFSASFPLDTKVFKESEDLHFGVAMHQVEMVKMKKKTRMIWPFCVFFVKVLVPADVQKFSLHPPRFFFRVTHTAGEVLLFVFLDLSAHYHIPSTKISF